MLSQLRKAERKRDNIKKGRGVSRKKKSIGDMSQTNGSHQCYSSDIALEKKLTEVKNKNGLRGTKANEGKGNAEEMRSQGCLPYDYSGHRDYVYEERKNSFSKNIIMFLLILIIWLLLCGLGIITLSKKKVIDYTYYEKTIQYITDVKSKISLHEETLKRFQQLIKKYTGRKHVEPRNVLITDFEDLEHAKKNTLVSNCLLTLISRREGTQENLVLQVSNVKDSVSQKPAAILLKVKKLTVKQLSNLSFWFNGDVLLETNQNVIISIHSGLLKVDHEFKELSEGLGVAKDKIFESFNNVRDNLNVRDN